MALACLLLTGCTIPVDGDGPTASTSTVVVTPGSAAPPPAPPVPEAPAPAGPTAPVPPALAADLDAAAAATGTVPGTWAVAIAPVGRPTTVLLHGAPDAFPAWSTSKVPLAIAALRGPAGAGQGANTRSALTASDNGAAEALWASLGDPAAAGAAVDAVLREGGDATTVTQTVRVRAGATPFGQTAWTTADQARFIAHVPCMTGTERVVTAMGQVAAGQRYGLGTLPGARFKGGWGPVGSGGGYTVRQLGVVDAPAGRLAVAVAVSSPNSGYGAGQTVLTALAGAIGRHLDELPAGAC